MRLNRLERFLVRVTTWDGIEWAIVFVLALVAVLGFLGVFGSLAEAPKP